MKKSLKVAVAQSDSVPFEVDVNLQRIEYLASRAKQDDVRLIVFPELFNVGYDLAGLRTLDYNFEHSLDFIKKTAKASQLHICCGMLEKENDRLYNSLFVVSDKGHLVTRYRKANLFPLSTEEEVFQPGNEFVVFDIDPFRFGLMICYDIRFPEISTEYIHRNCNALIISSAFPFPRLDHWRILLRSRAIENQCYVLASNRVGKDGGFWFCGNSSIIDPYGNYTASMNEIAEGIVSHEIDQGFLESTRKTIPCLANKTMIKNILKHE